MRPSSNPQLINALAVEVKLRRAELGLSQEALAFEAGLDRPYVSLIEVSRKQPSLSVLGALASGLNLGLGELMLRVEARYLHELASSKKIQSRASQ
jgi:transcriptional regulator with XRE-family HTH domain